MYRLYNHALDPSASAPPRTAARRPDSPATPRIHFIHLPGLTYQHKEDMYQDTDVLYICIKYN